MNNDRTETNEKQDRKERYQRRRSHVSTGSSDDSSRRRRATPYKRQRDKYDDTSWEEDDWFDEHD